jgi:epsilon-lactone hydrolase
MTSLRSRILHSTLQRVVSSLDTRLTIQEQRTRFDELALWGIRLPRGVKATIVQANGVPAEWVEPVAVNPNTAILYLHGGGYCLCSIDTHRGLAGRLALACRSRVLIIAYRLAPENPYPAALEDAFIAYHWMLRQGYSPRRVAFGGDSAGGGLTLATSLKLREGGEPLPAALFMLSPWTDLTFSGDSIQTRKNVDPIFGPTGDTLQFAPAYLGTSDPNNPYISPLFADLGGLPPTLIQVGNDEILLDDSTRLEKRLNDAGVDARLEVWDGMWHVFQSFAPFAPESQLAIDKIGSFFREQIPLGEI